jgi:hypothetical protein
LRAERDTLPRRQGAAERAAATIYFTSLGRSTGDVMTMTVLNHRKEPIQIDSDALVLEPVRTADRTAIAREIDRHPAVAKATTTIKGYCLEFLKAPPPAGMVFRLADATTARRFERFEWIIKASRRMRDFGLLPPDGGDPVAYVDSIRQWAIWITEQRFDQAKFGDAFVEHTRKAVVAAGRAWTGEFEQAARALVPGRWAVIQGVLSDAARLETAGRSR